MTRKLAKSMATDEHERTLATSTVNTELFSEPSRLGVELGP